MCEENKINDFIKQYLLFCLRLLTRSQEYQDTCLQAEKCTCVHRGTVMNARRRLTPKRRYWLVVIFVFFMNKVFSFFVMLLLNPWCHMDYFNDVLTTFLGLEWGSSLVCYAGSESSQILLNVSLCSEDEQRFYGFETTWGRVINHNFNFWLNYPFNLCFKSKSNWNWNLFKLTPSLFSDCLIANRIG